MIFNRYRRAHIEKEKFNKLCNANKIELDFDSNKNELSILTDIFGNREYADFFPFYKKATIVDIGAHYGYFSLFSAVNSDTESTIIAIEPEENNFNQLTKNIKNNTLLKNIIPINCAIGASSKSSKLFKGKSTNNSLIDDYSMVAEKGSTQDVEIKTLEQLMKENKVEKIDFLKMDCEGAEYGILENTPKNILDKIATISMEFHDLKKPKYTGEFIINILINSGFEVVKYKYERTSMGLNYGKIIGTKIYHR